MTKNNQNSKVQEIVLVSKLSQSKLFDYSMYHGEKLVEILNAHFQLIKACLYMPFQTEYYYIRDRDGKFIERGYDKRFYYVELLNAGTNEALVNGKGRSFYLPIKSQECELEGHELPEGAMVRIDNVQPIADAAAHMYGTKNVNDIIKFALNRNKNLRRFALKLQRVLSAYGCQIFLKSAIEWVQLGLRL